MIGRFPILYIAEADAEDAILSSGVLAHLVDSLPQASFTLVVHSTSAADVTQNQERVRRFARTYYITAIPAVAVLLHSVVAASENHVKVAYIGCAADGSLHARITTRPGQSGDSHCECIPNYRFLPLEGIEDESW